MALRALHPGGFAALLGLLALGCSSEHSPDTPATVVARDPLDIPPSPARTTPTTVDVTLTTREVVADLGGGRKASVWTFDDAVPGPLIRVIEGDTVNLTVTNAADSLEPHSVDLHAVMGPGGGDKVTEVAPGESKTLKFKASRQGAFFYHCAAEGMPWEHVAHGMFGVILVEPPGGLPAVDREAYVVQNEWYLKLGGGAEEEEEEEEHHAALPSDVWDLDEEAAEREQPQFFTFNGHQQALTSPELYGERVRVPQGGRARIIFANAGPNLSSSFHVVGGIFDQVFSGSFAAPAPNEETVLVPPGSAAVFELSAPVPGGYTLVDHALFRAKRGAAGRYHVDPEGAFPSGEYSPQP